MTATDPDGNTSELSQRLPFSVTPDSGPAEGGQGIAIAGTDFETGAEVMIGGLPAEDVEVAGFDTITAVVPALAPGSLNDVVVTNPDGSSGTLEKGYVADFLDVPEEHQFYTSVTRLVTSAVTAGIGGGYFGIDDPTLRQQMAVFLLKAKHGACYAPPPCSGVFPDVPCPSPFADWIEALAAEGITGGCGGGNFCPQNPVRRDQMAAFLLKSAHGSRLRAAAVRGRVRGRAVSVAVRRLDRAARGGEHHGGLRRRRLLPGREQHPGADGGIPGEGVLPPVGRLAIECRFPGHNLPPV